MAGVPAGLLAQERPRKPQGLLGRQDDLRGLLGGLLEAYTSQGLPGTFAGPFAAGIAKSMYQAAKLPGDVYAGRVDPASDEAIQRSADLAGSVTLGAGAIPAEANALRMGIKAYHGSMIDDFDEFDWSRLGENTLGEVAGSSNEEWAMNLAKIGPWAHESPEIGEKLAYGTARPVDIGGRGKEFDSLDELEMAVVDRGGPEKLRKSLLEKGYGHIKVADEEMGGTSYVALSPKNFKMLNR